MNERSRPTFTLADLRAWPATVIDTPAAALPRLAVLGDPVAHSLSPAMHNAALAASGIPGRYVPLHVRRDELPEAMRLLPQAGFLGVNLTLPHKTAAMALMNEVDAAAHRLGAVNTVQIQTAERAGSSGPTLRGFNTDGPGFLLALRDALGLEILRGRRVLVLGAGGGAGRALAVQCASAGCARLVLANRTAEKALLLADKLRREFSADTLSVEVAAMPEVPWHDAPLDEIDLVIHTTPLGLRDDDPSAIPASRLRRAPPDVLLYDTVYRRAGRLTPLVAAAREVGLRAADGSSLLLWQGALAFEIWFNRPAPVAAMRAALGTNSR